jgi:hypothetical protein
MILLAAQPVQHGGVWVSLQALAHHGDIAGIDAFTAVQCQQQHVVSLQPIPGVTRGVFLRADFARIACF